MGGVRNISLKEKEFFLDKKGRIKYNTKCEKCARKCKQSWQSTLISCSKRIKVKSKKEYIKKIKDLNKTINQVSHDIGVHSGTLKSLLFNNDKDMDFDIHKKLMKYLYNEDIKK